MKTKTDKPQQSGASSKLLGFDFGFIKFYFVF